MKKSIAILLILAFASCQRNELENLIQKPNGLPNSEEISIESAKEWFQQDEKASNSTFNKSIGKVVYWNEAKELKISNDNKNYVLAPASYIDTDNRYSSILETKDGTEERKKEDKEVKSKRKGYSTILKLLIFKNQDGKLEKRLLKIIPNEGYRNKSKNKEVYMYDFSGYVIASDWNTEKVLEGESVINGKSIGQLSFISSKTVMGAKLNNKQDCFITTISTTYAVPCGGGAQLKILSETCYETEYTDVLNCPTGGYSSIGASIFTISTTGSTGSGGGGYAGTENNANFFNRWYDSLENKYSVNFSYSETEYLKANLDLIPMVDAAIQNLTPRPSNMSLLDIASRSPNLKSKVGKHQMSLIDQLLYPKFTQVVKNLKSYVQNDNVDLNALIKYSGFSDSGVLSTLEFGNGPKIVVTQTPGVYGYFNKNINPNIINISSDWVQQLEHSLTLGQKEALSFLLAVTSLHEYVHWARYSNGLGRSVEFGELFEQEAYGLLITSESATTYSYKFYKK